MSSKKVVGNIQAILGRKPGTLLTPSQFLPHGADGRARFRPSAGDGGDVASGLAGEPVYEQHTLQAHSQTAA